MGKNIFEAAQWYQEKGFSVIPVRPDKKPFISWAKYQNETASEDQINEWWGHWPNANIGIVTGEVSDIDVIDCDSEAGYEALNEFLPEKFLTPCQKTPKGYHYFFKHRPGLSNGIRVLTDCDLRTDGGYVVVAPSVGKNGPYEWHPDLKINKVRPAPMPEILFDILQQGGNCQNASLNNHKIDNIPYRREGVNDTAPVDTCRHVSSNVVIDFQKGGRDNALFHLANCLVKGGMSASTIEQYLRFFGSNCTPPFPEKEVQAKIKSALNRAEKAITNLSEDVREFVLSSSGIFLSSDVVNGLQLSTRQDKKNLSKILSRLVDDGLIERTGSRNGQFRKIESDCDSIDFLNADSRNIDLWLPFNLDRLVEIMPGNIILLAGEPNAGKTGLLLNVIRANMRRSEMHYFNSEMGAGELKKRLSLFDDMTLDEWCFKAWERANNFADVIKAGQGKINIIDFLEIHDNFYEIGGKLAEIHSKLKGAIAIVALQKNRGTDTGLGGFRSLEKPRLALAMSPGILKIVKAKNWKSAENPNGKQVTFKVAKGCHFKQVRGWHKA